MSVVDNLVNNSDPQEFLSPEAPTPIYRHDFESKAWRIFKQVISIIIFPIGLAKFIHSLVGYIFFLPAASKTQELNENRDWIAKEIAKDPTWKIKRIAIEMDDYVIDAAIMCKNERQNNGRWTSISNGNGEHYENKLIDQNFKQFLDKANSNAILFNYPGVGGSTGSPNREAMAKANRVMLKFLEDKKQGIGADEVIAKGYSIGGGVLGEATEDYQFQPDVKYVVIKEKTFSDMSTTAKELVGPFMNSPFLGEAAGFVTKLVGWNITNSKQLPVPEIILQTGGEDEEGYFIEDDGIIAAKASHAFSFVDQEPKNKKFMYIKERHNSPLEEKTVDKLVEAIEEMLQQRSPVYANV